MRNVFLIAAAAGALLGAAPVAAQSTTAVSASPPAVARALLLRPLTFVKIDDLDFGTIVAGTTGGTVTIDPNSSARSTTGGATGVGSAPGHRAYFAGSGTANQNIAVMSLVAPAALTQTVVNGTTTTTYSIPVVGLTLDGSNVRTIDPATNAFYVGVGGSISVGANQQEGFYSATFDITADYQ